MRAISVRAIVGTYDHVFRKYGRFLRCALCCRLFVDVLPTESVCVCGRMNNMKEDRKETTLMPFPVQPRHPQCIGTTAVRSEDQLSFAEEASTGGFHPVYVSALSILHLAEQRRGGASSLVRPSCGVCRFGSRSGSFHLTFNFKSWNNLSILRIPIADEPCGGACNPDANTSHACVITSFEMPYFGLESTSEWKANWRFSSWIADTGCWDLL